MFLQMRNREFVPPPHDALGQVKPADGERTVSSDRLLHRIDHDLNIPIKVVQLLHVNVSSDQRCLLVVEFDGSGTARAARSEEDVEGTFPVGQCKSHLVFLFFTMLQHPRRTSVKVLDAYEHEASVALHVGAKPRTTVIVSLKACRQLLNHLTSKVSHSRCRHARQKCATDPVTLFTA